MTLTKVANIYSEENSLYRKNLETLYPPLFEICVTGTDFKDFTRKFLYLIINSYKEIDALPDEVYQGLENSKKEDKKKFKFFLKLEVFCLFVQFYIKNNKDFHALINKKLVKNFHEKCIEFKKAMKDKDMTLFSEQERLRFKYLQGKIMFALFFLKKNKFKSVEAEILVIPFSSLHK